MITELGSGDLTGDALRIHRAVGHCRAITLGTLSVHAVAMACGNAGVLLFGGHGAGKSMTGLALAARGWRALAGDVALVRVLDDGGRLRLSGGTRRFLLRPGSRAARELEHPSSSASPRVSAAARIDVTDRVTWVALNADDIDARLAVNVTVDSGAGPTADVGALDAHTSQSVWWRASSYLLDRVLEDPAAEPLRSMEHPALSVARVGLVYSAARLLPVREAFGTADGIAEAIEHELTEEFV